jgi:hypothetical protein
MSLKRKELVQIYEEVRSRYKRKERDKDIHRGMDELYDALIHYMDFDTHIGKN